MAIEEKSVMHVTRSLIQAQRQQINAIENMFNEICSIKDEMNTKFALMESMVKRVEDSVYIYYEEQRQMQSIVAERANELAQTHYNQDDIPWDEREDYGAEIRELAGYTIRKLWKALKDHFEVTRYSSIRRVDFEDAIEFLKNFPLDKAFLADFEKWKEQRRKKQEREAKWNA